MSYLVEHSPLNLPRSRRLRGKFDRVSQYDDTASRLARLEAQHQSLLDSLNRHDIHLGDIEDRMEKARDQFSESLKELTDNVGGIKTRVIGYALALGVIIAFLNFIGTAVAIWAALR